MSSIDKYVEEAAKNVDSRVKVTNSGGRIIGRINGQVVFNIADRYGYLHDDEKQTVQNGVRRYLRQEQNAEEERRRREEEERRRREEEERRRREEEERRRRLEEQRQAAMAAARRAVENKRQEVERYFGNIQNPVGSSKNLDPELASMFDMNGVVSAASNDVATLRSSFDKKLSEAKRAALARVEDEARRINANMSTESANQVVASVGGVHPSFDPKPFTDRFNELNEGVNQIIAAARAMMQQLRAFDAQFHNEVSASLLQRVKNIKIRNTADFAQIVEMVQQTTQTMQETAARAELERSVQAFMNASGKLSGLSISCDVELGHELERPSFAPQIAEKKQRILQMRNDLLHAEYTTLETATSNDIIAFYESEEDSEETLRACDRILDTLQKVAIEDQRLEVKYEAFQRSVAEARSRGIPCDQPFDTRDPDGQRDQIDEQIFVQELEAAKEEMWSRNFTTDAIMQELGYELISVEEVGGVMVSNTYAKKGMEGAVMQVLVTKDGVHRRLVGIKTQGQESSVETVKEAGRMLERENEPARFLQGYKTCYPEAVMAEDMGLADDPGIDRVIEDNGSYDLDASGKAEVFRSVVGETQTQQKVSTYIPARQHDVSVTIQREATNQRARMKQQTVKRYQTK